MRDIQQQWDLHGFIRTCMDSMVFHVKEMMSMEYHGKYWEIASRNLLHLSGTMIYPLVN
jgi:hypothetical protein